MFWLCPILERRNLVPIRRSALYSILAVSIIIPAYNISLNTAFMVCTTDTYLFSVLHFMIILSRQVMRTAQYWWTSNCLRMMENNMLLVEIAWSPSDLWQITHVTENWMGTYVICTSRRMKIGLSGVSLVSSFIYRPFALAGPHEAFWEEMKW